MALAFKEIPGLPGKVYIPEQNPDAPKKHNCRDCFSCQMCSDSRCRVCRRHHAPRQCRSKNKPAAPFNDPFIMLEKITIRSAGKSFFRNLDWKIYSDQHWAIIGPTSSGKSLLVKALQRKVPLSAGRIDYFFDRHPAGEKQARRYLERGEIIRVALDENEKDRFHQARWHSMEAEASIRVSDYLDPENIQKRSPYELIEPETDTPVSVERRDELLRQMASGYLLTRRMVHLSNGELRKIKIIRALMQSPRLLIIENPLAGLDEAARQAMDHILQNLLASFRPQVMIVSTTLEDLPAGISHVLCVSDNQILAKGEREDVLNTPSVRHVFSEDQTTSARSPGELPVAPHPFSPENKAVIEMKQVSVRYQGISVLEDITWRMGAFEHWAVLGRNGAGKSTLLSLVLADNPQAYANDIKLFGKNRGSGESIWEIKQHMGWVAPELHRAYADGFSCMQVVCSGFYDSIGLYQRPSKKQIDTAAGWMRDMGIDHLSEHPFSRVSEGEQRLVLICRALVKRPRLLILDEPCMGLDNSYRRQILNLLDALCHQRAAQLLYVTHRLEELPAAITHVLKLENGQIAAQGRRQQILDEYPTVNYTETERLMVS